MHAEELNDTEGAAGSGGGETALAIQGAVSAVLAFGVTVVWAADGFGSFWPVWVWFGLSVPIGVHLGLRWALRAPAGWTRGLAIHAAMTAVVCAVLFVVWALAGAGMFWPAWPLFWLGTALAIHTIFWNAFGRPDRGREQELEHRVDELTRTRRGALDVQAAQLRRIERDLHDGAQARLVALSMQLGRAEARLGDQPEVAELLRAARGEASAAIAELRDLARGIAPPVLADRGLRAAVEALGQRAAIPVDVDVRIERRPPPVVETAAYFVVAEALTNVAKHAGGAGAHVTVQQADGRLVIVVGDTGPGGADPAGGGLTGLRHRVEALDGTLIVHSASGEGTTIRAELPCES
jgi:signal transduction histidine kinase